MTYRKSTKQEIAQAVRVQLQRAAAHRMLGNKYSASVHLTYARMALAHLNARIYADRLTSLVMAFPKRISFGI